MKETKADYAFNLIIGHHGLFSLSPIFFLSLIGMAMTLAGHLRRPEKAGMVGTPGLMNRFRQLPGTVLFAAFTLILTFTVLAFYFVKGNNYVGWTSGPRVLMWLTPLLLLTM